MATIARLLVYAAGLVIAGACCAQTAYPNRPVRIIVPFAPGGSSDVFARLVAPKLSESLGKQFYIENHGGAGGNLGMGLAASAAPDGHTILIVTNSFVVNPSLYAKIPYDPFRSFAAVTLAVAAPNVVSVHPSLPVTSVKELVAYIRANPGKLNYASPGAGTTPHLGGELFRLSLGLDLVHVPFNGAGPAVGSTVAGHTPILFSSLPPAAAQIKQGLLRALAVTSPQRTPTLPDVPTMEEAGFPNQESDLMQGVLLPAGTPKEIVDLLYREIARIVALPDVKERLSAIGFEPVASTPDEFAVRIKAEIAKWDKVVREAKIKVE